MLGRGHNRRVQDDDPSMHGETSAFRNAGRQRTYAGTTMVTTLSPCWYCSGLVRQFGISRVVVGEATTFFGGHEWLAENGVEVVVLEDPDLHRADGGLHRRPPGPVVRGHRRRPDDLSGRLRSLRSRDVIRTEQGSHRPYDVPDVARPIGARRTYSKKSAAAATQATTPSPVANGRQPGEASSTPTSPTRTAVTARATSDAPYLQIDATSGRPAPRAVSPAPHPAVGAGGISGGTTDMG